MKWLEKTIAYAGRVAFKSWFDDLVTLFAGGSDSKAGVTVNHETALRVSTVFACSRVLAEGIAQLPLKVYQEKPDGGKIVFKKHPLYKVLFRRANSWMTGFEFRETMMYHAVITGNAYAYINRVDGEISELIPLLPTRVAVKQLPSGEPTYEVRDAFGAAVLVPRSDIMHLRGPSWNGFLGMDAVHIARDAIGLSIAIEEGQARLHANGVNPSGIVSVSGTLSPASKESVRQWIRDKHSGPQNSGSILVLDQAGKFERMSMTGVDAQLLETRKHQVEEICRFMRVFPQMVGFSDKTSTYASAEQFFLAHVTHSLGPWVERWEEAIERDLLDGEENIIVRFSVQALMRGDAKSRAEYYASGIANGWLTRNDARRREDQDPLDGLDEPLVPMNMGTQADRSAAMAASLAQAKSMIGRMDDDIEVKVGRVISALNERRITDARDNLDQVLSSMEFRP